MRLFIVAAIGLFASTGRTQAQVKSIDEIKIEKVGVDASLDDFRKLHPDAEIRKDEDNKYGVKVYLLKDQDGETYSYFHFLDDKLMSMNITWTDKGLKEAGGEEKIVDKIVKKYGKADRTTELDAGRFILWWRTEKTALIMHNTKFGLHLGVISQSVQKKLDELKKKSKN